MPRARRWPFPIWRRFCRNGIPEYLARHYWWAYLWRWGIWFFDHQPIIDAILFGQYRALLGGTREILEAAPIGRLLQVACVYGGLTPSVAQSPSVDGMIVIDVADGQLRLCREKCRSANTPGSRPVALARMNAESLAFADGSFDTVLLFFLLHELPPSARSRVLHECLRVLGAGGRLIIVEYGERTSRHLLHRWLPLRWALGAVEPFLPSFWDEDLDARVAEAARERVGGAISSMHRSVFGGFHRLSEYRLRRDRLAARRSPDRQATGAKPHRRGRFGG